MRTRVARNPTIFFDISLLLRSTKEVTTKNLSLNKWKTWPVEFSKDCKKCEKKLHEVRTQTSEANLEILKCSNPPKARTDRSKKFSDRFWYMEPWNQSSYAKVMAILRADSELEGKTVRKREKFAAVARNWWKQWGNRHELDSNKS